MQTRSSAAGGTAWLIQGLVGALFAAGVLITLALVETVRSPVFPGDPRPLLAVYMLAGVCAGVGVVLAHERPLLGGTAASCLLAAGLIPWPQRGAILVAAGALSAATAVALRCGPGTAGHTLSGRRNRRPGGWLRPMAVGVGATLALVALLAVSGWAGQVERSAPWPLASAGSHLALGTVAGAIAVAHRWQALVPGLPAVVSAVVLAQALPTWIEIPVEAGVGHLVALLVGLLAVAAVAGLARRRVAAAA